MVDSVFALEIFDSTVLVPYSHKNLVVHHPDSTGNPPCSSSHGQAAGLDSAYDNGDTGPIITLTNRSQTDAVDFYCYWKLFDALQDCALNGNGCTTSFGDTYAQKFAGTWSDSTPIMPLEVRPVVVAPTTIPVLDNMEDLKVSPNPASNLISVSFSNGLIDQISICNILGQQVLSKKPAIDNTNSVLDISRFPSGIYFVQAFANGKNTAIKKLVIER